MKTINTSEFEKEIGSYKGVVLVDFYAEWCGPCRMVSPILEDLAKEYDESDVKIVKVNVDDSQDLAMQYGVMSIPVIMAFKDGQLVTQRVGVARPEDYKAMIENAKNSKAQGENEVIVFSTPTCPWCDKAKAYLEAKGISYKSIDVSSDEKSAAMMISRSGQMGVPQLWIKNQVVIGYDPERIDSLLK